MHMSNHAVTIAQLHTSGEAVNLYRGECTCGFVTPERNVRSEAEADGINHMLNAAVTDILSDTGERPEALPENPGPDDMAKAYVTAVNANAQLEEELETAMVMLEKVSTAGLKYLMRTLTLMAENATVTDALSAMTQERERADARTENAKRAHRISNDRCGKLLQDAHLCLCMPDNMGVASRRTRERIRVRLGAMGQPVERPDMSDLTAMDTGIRDDVPDAMDRVRADTRMDTPAP